LLESKTFIKYLGILLDSNLSWKAHIDYISLKISKTIGIISRLRHDNFISIFSNSFYPSL
jgi:hypothetical protein